MSGGSISDTPSAASGRGAGKWESRFHKQVEANNLMSDKLRKLRKVGEAAHKRVVDIQKAYSLQMSKLIVAQARILELERIIGEESEDEG